MSKLKRSILILAISIIIIIIIILSIIYLNRGEIIYEIDEIGSDEEIFEFDSSLKYVTSRDEYYTVKTCIEKFYIYYAAMFNEDKNYKEIDLDKDIDILKSEIQKSLYNMLDDEYIRYKDIDVNNIISKMDVINSSKININNMIVSKKNENLYVYIIQGKLREISSGKISDFEILLKMDALNKTFSILLSDYVQENYKDIQVGNEINIEVLDNIKNKGDNIYEYKIISDETYVNDLFLKYKEEILFDTKSAYNHLDVEYKKNKFDSFEKYQDYIKSNISKNVTIKLSKYQRNNYENYTEYICLDQYGNYYIFNEKSVMNFNIILDTYTVYLPEFIKKYDNGNEKVKVGMNIEKVFDAINAKDYSYVYNKLDDTFKRNNVANLSDFIKFVNNELFEKNEVNYIQFDNMGGVYTYHLKINDSDNAENFKNVLIVIKLLENRNFVFSFEIE